MSDWLISLEGTEAGRTLALCLALLAAVLHALFGALQKGRTDPWTARTVIDASYSAMAVPFLFLVPFPEPHLWPLLAIAWVIHVGYKMAQAATYSVGSYLVVYPVVRGTSPVFTVIGAGLLFGEVFQPLQWLGVALLVGGIFGFSAYNLRHVTLDRNLLPRALGLAVMTGGLVALYTTWDAFVIRATADPFTFIAWFFFLDGLAFPAGWLALKRRWPRFQAHVVRLGLTGAVTAYFSFGSIMLATRLDKVGEAAVLRETSVLFSALISWLVLKEGVGPRRLALMALIAAGAVIVEWGGRVAPG
ncbi:MAG: EamA family transporter [Paracoccaceae bacterium]|nr:EamA family transporter [Paracoccaceae bacterium]